MTSLSAFRGPVVPVVPVLFAAAVLALAVGGQSPLGRHDFDLVIANGRVMDPESGLDAVRNVGVREGRVASISSDRLSGRTVIDATGLVVSPGFIDLHAHGQTPETYRMQAFDGVTTSLELEVGTSDVDGWYAARRDGRLINYGVSAGHIPVRMAVLHDPGAFLPSGPGAHRAATPGEVAEIVRRLELGLKQGAVSMGAGLPYTEAATPSELLQVFRVAGKNHVSIHVHIRPGVAGLQEALKLAAQARAPLHVVHLNSAGTSETPAMLKMIESARKQGRDVTTEAYPYNAGMTEIRSAILDQYLDAPDEKFRELEWPRTGETLTRETFAKYRAIGGPVIRRTNTEPMVALAIDSPLTMIASDAYWENGTGHPRTAGTYSRVLGRYVRGGAGFKDERASASEPRERSGDSGAPASERVGGTAGAEPPGLSLMEALRKMTLMPAQRLEKRVAALGRKGRLKLGADADLTIFDPARVLDRSTYADPSHPPDGIRDVIVNGVPVIFNGEPVDGVAPGRAVRAGR